MRERYRAHGLEIRIGIHTGPAVAGIVGTHRYVYDLCGDTVNTAGRMESHGLPDEIQLGATTVAALGGGLPTRSRGVVTVKGKGPM